MSTSKLNKFLSASLKSSVALLPLAIAVSQMPAYGQAKTQAQLEAEAAAAKAEAATGADADDAAAVASLLGGRTGTSTGQSTKDIVITGTNIRGVKPTGTNLNVVTKEDIQATGQTSMNQLLTTIPGFSNFNSVPNNGGAAAQGTGGNVGRPNLRGTPDGDLGSAGVGDPGSATLVLIDGNRQSGGGIRSSATDPESISPALLERVEVNTDGGSATYGSDAIGGVVNFVTKKRYNGAEISGRLGYADKYWQYDGTALVGKDWGSGSAYISGNYAANTPLFNRDRDFAKTFSYDTGLQQGLNCNNPNISIASVAATVTGGSLVSPAIPAHYYKVNADGSISRTGDVIVNDIRQTAGTSTPTGGLPTTLPPEGAPANAINGASVNTLPNLCDLNLLATRVNRTKRYGVSGNFFQKITDNIDFLARGNYSYVWGRAILAPLTINTPVGANNPWRRELKNGVDGTGTTDATYPIAQPGYPTPLDDVIRSGVPVTQTVLTNLSTVYGDQDAYADNWIKKFGGNAEVTWRIDGNWLLKATGVYDRTTTKVHYGMSSFSGGAAYLGAYYDTGVVCSAAETVYAAAGGNTVANGGGTPAAVAAAVAARTVARQSCLDPYNPEDSNPILLAAAHNVDSKSLAHEAIIDAKANLDGALFEIPGGKIRVALGGEYLREDFEKWQYASQQPVPFSDVHGTYTVAHTGTATISDAGYAIGWNPSVTQAGNRATWSVYGEVNIPLISRANELTWIKEFRISAGARYDKIQIFGSTFNPHIGADFRPTSWLGFHGTWSTNFRAPNVILSVAAEASQIVIDPIPGGSTNIANANPVPINGQVLWIYNAGARKSLKPQTGNQWSIGFDLTPFRGLKATVSYGHIDYIDALATAAPNTGARGSTLALATYGLPGLPGQGCTESDVVVVLDQRVTSCTAAQIAAGANPMNVLTDAQIAAAKAAFCADALNCTAVMADGRPVYGLYDTRFRNSGNSKIGNVDYNIRYNSATPWGSIYVSVNGSIAVIRKSQSTDFTPFVNGFANGGSRHSMTAQAGFTFGPLNASATLQHSDGYRVARSSVSPQDRVADFNVINTFATWTFKGDNVVERNLQLSLSINNILNTSPPVRYSNNTISTANGSTIGRLIQLGFNKKF